MHAVEFTTFTTRERTDPRSAHDPGDEDPNAWPTPVRERRCVVLPTVIYEYENGVLTRH